MNYELNTILNWIYELADDAYTIIDNIDGDDAIEAKAKMNRIMELSAASVTEIA